MPLSLSELTTVARGQVCRGVSSGPRLDLGFFEGTRSPPPRPHRHHPPPTCREPRLLVGYQHINSRPVHVFLSSGAGVAAADGGGAEETEGRLDATETL